jgi:hypothetical protein
MDPHPVCVCLVVRRPLGIADMPVNFCLLTWCDMIEFGISGKSPHLTLVCWKGCFLEVHRLTLAQLYRRTLGRQIHVSRLQGVPRGGVDDIWDENQQAVHLAPHSVWGLGKIYRLSHPLYGPASLHENLNKWLRNIRNSLISSLCNNMKLC